MVKEELTYCKMLNRIYIKPNEIIKLLKVKGGQYKLRIHFLRNIKSDLGRFLFFSEVSKVYKDFCFNSARFFSIPFGLPFSNRLAVNDPVGVNISNNYFIHTHWFMDKQSGVSVHNRYHGFGLFSAHPFIACNPRNS